RRVLRAGGYTFGRFWRAAGPPPPPPPPPPAPPRRVPPRPPPPPPPAPHRHPPPRQAHPRGPPRARPPPPRPAPPPERPPAARRPRHPGQVEEPAEVRPVPLLLRDEQPDGVKEVGVADLRRVGAGRRQEARPVGRLPELPGAQRVRDRGQLVRGHLGPAVPGD